MPKYSSIYSLFTESILKKFELFWQYPVITEKTFYLQNKDDPDLLQLPWATIIDKNLGEQLDRIFEYLYLKKQYYTCCQHIHFRQLIPYFKKYKINKVYSPHKLKSENKIQGIEILPCPLYAVNVEDPLRNKEFLNKNFITLPRKYWYSFIGGFDKKCYLTDIREKIFNLQTHENNVIINTGGWYFNKIVYSNKQNIYNELNTDNEYTNNNVLYNNILLNSRFSLCPSGTGPNTIRFWESLAVGSIPVLLSDSVDLPKNIEWEKFIVIVKEKNIKNIEKILKDITLEEEAKMRIKCIEIYNKLKNNYRNL
ncbi:exostosin family protein [Hyphomonas sp.]|jgi:hypothetical protein|uniref:exostosin domain-containing protein n=1 Tax=Hyphomonas sp. TaxID=87 RepID=UPI0037BE4823